jgi:putative ABC transport system permease protein
VAATGGTARDVRRVVLAQALVLGVGAATIGAVLGIAVAAVLVAVLPRVSPLELGPWQVDWRYVGAAFALGALASLLAAFLPAIAASRSNVVAVLAGRRGDAPARRGWPVLGAVLIAAGTAAVLTLGTRQGGEFVVAGGTLTMVIGAIVAMPWIIGAVGRLGSHLPLPLRLATRDSARQRARTAPAVAAVMAAVAGLTTLAVGFSSDFEQSRREYQPRHPAGVTTVSAYSADERTWRSVDSAAARDLPGRPLLPYGTLGRSMATGTGPMTAVYVRRPGCPATPPRETVQGQFHCYDWMFDGKAPASWGGAGPLVATPEALAALGYRLDATQRSVLDAGGVLLPAESLAARGRATLTTYKDDGITTSDVQNHDVKAGYLPPRRNGGTVEVLPVVLTPAAAEAMGLEWSRTGGVLAQSATPLGKDAQDRLEESLRGVTGDLELYTERGFVQSRSLPLLALFGTAVLVVLVGTLTATGLALNDSRPDLATLASVGAKPRTRRIMAAAQALVIGLLGAVTGVLVGLVPGIAVAFPLTSQGYNPSTGMSQSGSPTIVVPWLLLLVVALAVPALAAATAGIGVRSKLPLTRRLGQ